MKETEDTNKLSNKAVGFITDGEKAKSAIRAK